ncbi:butyrate response factor [Nematocida sp. AWRm80]|nr:butyrate response factor [Nematocida sp. AWRm80]
MNEEREVFRISIDTCEYEKVENKEKKRGKRSISRKKISLYKTEICKSFESSSFCTYGDKCQFAHSLEELRDIERHPRYKTELCKTYTAFGACSYGKRCCFIHAGPNDDIHTDLQDARNIPGDWKTPGIPESTEIEMSGIFTSEIESKETDILTGEENERLNRLYKYKVPQKSMCYKPFKLGIHSISPGNCIGFRNSSSFIWTRPYLCFSIVDSGCKIISIKPLGKAPGSIALEKTN